MQCSVYNQKRKVLLADAYETCHTKDFGIFFSCLHGLCMVCCKKIEKIKAK